MDRDFSEFWELFLSELEKKNIAPITFNTWFKRMVLKSIDYEREKIVIMVPTKFIRDYLSTNKKHLFIIGEVLTEITGIDFDIAIISEGENINYVEPKETPNIQKQNLNAKYIFENFVVGKSNEFAHAASVAVAENYEDPSSVHSNPLFLYGGVGLGKTHLMQAIGHYIQEQAPNKKVLYVTSENFTNEFINCIRTGKNEEFRNKYRYVDLLLIDDVQFMSNKEGTQEEFFHTFNALYENNKQMVFTSDTAPQYIKNVEERLISRFAWGLVVDIGQPDLETRIAILNAKAEAEGFDIPKEVIYFIAENVRSNIRELEGALSRVVAYSKITVGEITVEDASRVLKDIYKTKRKKIDADLIKKHISSAYSITTDDLDSKKRTKSIVYPRQLAMYITRELTDLSLPKIGEVFGGRDHTTVIHAYEKIKTEIETDEDTRNTVENLIKEIRDC